MNKKYIRFIIPVLTLLLVGGFFFTVFATGFSNNGSIKTVSDCSDVNDNRFLKGQNLWVRGDNFDEGSNYYFEVVKVNQPDAGKTVKVGSFTLASGQKSYCLKFWETVSCFEDKHDEYKVDVQKQVTGGFKKVDSDNFFVDCEDRKPSPKPSPTSEPCDSDKDHGIGPSDDFCPTPKPSVVPSPIPTPDPTSTPTPTPVSDPSPTPTPVVTPVPSPIVSPSPSPVDQSTPTPTPVATIVNNNTNNTTVNNNNDQNQNQTNNQTNNQTTSVLGEATSSGVTKSPATGIGDFALAGMFSAGPFGFLLSKFRKGKVLPKKKEDLGLMAFGLANAKNSQTKKA